MTAMLVYIGTSRVAVWHQPARRYEGARLIKRDEAINNPRDDESWWITELLRTNAELICRVDGAAASPSLTV